LKRAAKERVLTTHVPEGLAREVDALAGRLDRPRAWVVKEALSQFVELEAHRHQLTLEALAEVDQGEVSNQSAVERWAGTLTRRRTTGRG
jgi:predicted transcriptional regulator